MESFSLTGKSALVTGASRGIGQAIALGLAGAGADIVLAARSVDRLEAVARDIEAIGKRAWTLPMDVSDTQAIDAAFSSIDARGLTPSLLINNAGLEEVRPSLEVDEALWDRILGTNLKGAFFVSRAFAERLQGAGRHGAIVNVCSLTSGVGVPTATPYTSSKSGLLGMTRALASEWADQSIRVNGIGPGYFRTELTDVFYQDLDWQDAMLRKIPMGRFGKLEDLVGVCVFLCSDASAYITGQLIYVDGGYMASI